VLSEWDDSRQGNGIDARLGCRYKYWMTHHGQLANAEKNKRLCRLLTASPQGVSAPLES